MAVISTDGTLAIVQFTLRPGEIPDLLRRHAKKNPGTPAVEKLGERLIQGRFAPADAALFVTRVCQWGGGDRFVGRVLRNNTPTQIARALRLGLASALQGRVSEGVERIRELRWLGQSFASKQLRFLTPTHAVILDSVLRGALGYAEDVDGYGAFLADCQAILDHARTSDQLDARARATLRVCDVEAAIFTKIQNP